MSAYAGDYPFAVSCRLRREHLGADVKSFFILLFVALIGVGGAATWEQFNPTPPAEYEVVYFGSYTCGACKAWKRDALPAWKREPASRVAAIRMAELGPGSRSAFEGGYGPHDAVFRAAFGKRNSISWPSFVLLKDGEVASVHVGQAGWRQIEARLRRADENARKWAARGG